MTATSSTAPTGDRRVRRSRAALRAAIVALVLDKGFHGITGDDIADRADVTRATFYKHYQNKEDLLNDVVDDFTERVIASFDGTGSGRLQRLFDQVAAEPDVCRVILRGEGDGLALRRFTAAVEAVIADDYDRIFATPGGDAAGSSARRLAVSMRAASIVAAVGWFLDQDPSQEDTSGAEVTSAAAAESVLAALQPAWPTPPSPPAVDVTP